MYKFIVAVISFGSYLFILNEIAKKDSNYDFIVIDLQLTLNSSYYNMITFNS